MIVKHSPLEGMNMGTVATVAMRELQGLHTLDLRVAPGSLAHTAVVDALSMNFSTRPGQIQSGLMSSNEEKPRVLCLAPDWWLIVGFGEAEQRLSKLRDQYHFSVVDVSGQRTTIELEGPYAREVLAHLWEQDLREKSFPVSSVSQGLMAKAPVIVCRLAPFRYHLMVRSSFALHLWKALLDAAAEWV